MWPPTAARSDLVDTCALWRCAVLLLCERSYQLRPTFAATHLCRSPPLPHARSSNESAPVANLRRLCVCDDLQSAAVEIRSDSRGGVLSKAKSPLNHAALDGIVKLLELDGRPRPSSLQGLCAGQQEVAGLQRPCCGRDGAGVELTGGGSLPWTSMTALLELMRTGSHGGRSGTALLPLHRGSWVICVDQQPCRRLAMPQRPPLGICNISVTLWSSGWDLDMIRCETKSVLD